MRHLMPRLRALVVAALIAVTITPVIHSLGTVPQAAASTAYPAGIARFAWAIGQVESRGNYYAHNRHSGSFGKYQIMPRNWPFWAERYLGTRHAAKTPANQDRVAFGKFTDLYRKFGRWDRVAHWWLTGSSEPNAARWSRHSRYYTNKVMGKMRIAPANLSGPATATTSGLQVGDTRYATRTLWLRTAAGLENRRIIRITPGAVLHVVDIGRSSVGRLWIKVQLRSGRVGWIASRYTRS